MAFRMIYNRDSNVLVVYVVGTFTLDEMRAVGDAIVNSTEFSPDVNALWDLNQMDFSVADYELATHIINYRKSINALRSNARAAMVFDYALAEPLVKLYKIMSSELGQQIELFRYHKDAMAWLCKE